MKAKSLSRGQALAVSRDYQYLRGSRFDANHSIDLIVAAPYSRILQWQYVQNLIRKGGDASSVIADNPTGFYDVLLISYALNSENGFVTKDLRSYLAEHSVPFKESIYSCLRSSSIPAKILEQVLR